jgi:hypothetical protein
LVSSIFLQPGKDFFEPFFGFPLVGLEFLFLLFRQLDYSPLMGLVMKEFDPERVTLPNQEWFVESKGDNRVKCICLPHAGLPELGQGFVQFQGGSLEPLVKEEPEEFLAKLRFLVEKVLVQSLVYLKLLAEEEVDLPLLLLGFLLGQ